MAEFKAGDFVLYQEDDIELIVLILRHYPNKTDKTMANYDPEERYWIRCVATLNDVYGSWSKGAEDRLYLKKGLMNTNITVKATKLYNFDDDLEEIINE